MNKTPLSILAVLCASLAMADDFKTTDGKEYKNVKVSRVEPDGIVVITKSGISKLYFTELPKDVQERFNYDPEKAAAAYAAKVAAAQQAEELKKQRRAAYQARERQWAETIRRGAEHQGSHGSHWQAAATRRQFARRNWANRQCTRDCTTHVAFGDNARVLHRSTRSAATSASAAFRQRAC